jgi:hypothetical protein
MRRGRAGSDSPSHAFGLARIDSTWLREALKHAGRANANPCCLAGQVESPGPGHDRNSSAFETSDARTSLILVDRQTEAVDFTIHRASTE